jgi:uncharacterized membrane protein YvbJ
MSLLMPNFVEIAIDFVVAYWRWFVIFTAVVLVFVLIGFIFKAFHHAPKLDQKQIQRAQTAIATQDREEMTKVLVESDVQEKKIDANVAYANTETVNAIADSKKQWADKSNDELAAELERRAQEP